MSLYADYVKELRGFNILENEHGFIVYDLTELTCYISDIFVSIEKRGTGLAAQMFSDVVEIASKYGCRNVFGSVDPRNRNPTLSIKAQLSVGMKFVSVKDGILFFACEI